MSKSLNILERVRIASPCPASWSDMTGDDRVRFCGQCGKNVYNLSALSRVEAESLIRAKEGRLCGMFYRRGDGTVLTADCPVGLRAIRRRLARLAGGIAAALAFLFGATGLVGGAGRIQWLRNCQPFATMCNWLFPAAAPAPAIRKPRPKPQQEFLKLGYISFAPTEGPRDGSSPAACDGETATKASVA